MYWVINLLTFSILSVSKMLQLLVFLGHIEITCVARPLLVLTSNVLVFFAMLLTIL